jgi:Ca-activated chloride channel homolog
MTGVDVEYPSALVLLVLIPLFRSWKKRRELSTGFSAVSLIAKELGPSLLKRQGINALAVLFLVSAILGLANFRYSSVWQQSFLESKWIMIVQDLSGSMNRPSGDRSFTLGDVALQGAKAFVDLRRQDDLIGVVAFSSYARLIAPPTFDKEILKEKLELLSRKADSIVFRELTVGGATNASYATWLALCTFFMLLPEQSQLSYEELTDFRYSLLGKTLRNVEIPDKLTRIRFGHGMAIVLFTDGRIEANKTEEDVRKGLPNFVNVLQLLKKLGVKIYLIIVGGEVNEEVQAAIDVPEQGQRAGQIFYMPRTFSVGRITEVYEKINELEKNRLLVKLAKKKKETRWWCTWIAAGFLVFGWGLQSTPWFRKI